MQILIKNPKQKTEYKNFINPDARSPNSEPKADLNALTDLLLLKNSPIIAPKKGPNKIPPGMGMKIPIISPTLVPVSPYFELPNFFAATTGTKKSNIVIIIDVAKIRIKIIRLKLQRSKKYNTKNPKPLMIGPGKIGKKLPMTPAIINSPEINKTNTSIGLEYNYKRF